MEKQIQTIESVLCGCGHGVATHGVEGRKGLVLHILSEGNCCRMIAPDYLQPKKFRFEVWNEQPVEVCTVNGCTITKYTLTDQRLYSFHKSIGKWSMPKNKRSINSIGDNW